MKLLLKFIFVWPEVWKNISLNKKRLFYIYIFLSEIIMIIDFLSIASLMNVVGYATNNEIISRNKLNILIKQYKYYF